MAAGTDQPLSTRALNRAVLARQQLLEPGTATPEQVLTRVCGLQTQYAPTGYVGLFSRTAGFTADQLTDALHTGAVVQAWAMRCTIHMLAAPDYSPFTAAVRPARRTWFRRSGPVAADLDMPAVAMVVRELLLDGPRKQAEIQRHLTDAGWPRQAWTGVQLWLDLVRVPPAGTLPTPRAHVYGLAEQFVPGYDPDADPRHGEELLVRRYLAGFGPAAPRDVASFCGWTITATRAVLDRLALRRLTGPDGKELLDVPDGLLPDPDTPAPVRFLGQWEAVLLVHARRTQVLPEADRARVFATTSPQSVPTFLVDGQVAGTWTLERAAGSPRIQVQPFVPLGPTAAAEVAAEADRLAQLYPS